MAENVIEREKNHEFSTGTNFYEGTKAGPLYRRGAQQCSKGSCGDGLSICFLLSRSVKQHKKSEIGPFLIDLVRFRIMIKT